MYFENFIFTSLKKINNGLFKDVFKNCFLSLFQPYAGRDALMVTAQCPESASKFFWGKVRGY